MSRACDGLEFFWNNYIKLARFLNYFLQKLFSWLQILPSTIFELQKVIQQNIFRIFMLNNNIKT